MSVRRQRDVTVVLWIAAIALACGCSRSDPGPVGGDPEPSADSAPPPLLFDWRPQLESEQERVHLVLERFAILPRTPAHLAAERLLDPDRRVPGPGCYVACEFRLHVDGRPATEGVGKIGDWEVLVGESPLPGLVDVDGDDPDPFFFSLNLDVDSGPGFFFLQKRRFEPPPQSANGTLQVRLTVTPPDGDPVTLAFSDLRVPASAQVESGSGDD